MFYSQFILAKKGPLGTIWIAAHLERKLRKNQVADTDIGISVDSILFPEVPIALRLSSHLLLGVVRIYSRKVNYLFDDCSEALLKVKQAFRSAAVDLPPEESTAPYHSITLPETFDLDDFELPDNDIFQGNYVDHHVSTREQITLQDTMDGVVYTTSQFGLDERFGDGDASQIGLDLDEDLLLDKAVNLEHDGILDGNPQLSTQVERLQQNEERKEVETVTLNGMQVKGSGSKIDGLPTATEVGKCAQGLSTPRFEEQNFFHTPVGQVINEGEYHSSAELLSVESTLNSCSAHHLEKDAIVCSLQNFVNVDGDMDLQHAEDDSFVHLDGKREQQEHLACVMSKDENLAADNHFLMSSHLMVPTNKRNSAPLVPECKEGTTNSSDIPEKLEDLNDGVVINDEQVVDPLDQSVVKCVVSRGVVMNEILASPTCSHVTSDVEDHSYKLLYNLNGSQEPELDGHLKDVHMSSEHGTVNGIDTGNNEGESCPCDEANIPNAVHPLESLGIPEVVDVEAQVFHALKEAKALDHVARTTIQSTELHLQPSTSHLSQLEVSPVDGDWVLVTNVSDPALGNDQAIEPSISNEILPDLGKSDEQLESHILCENQVESINKSAASDVPEPEKMLSLACGIDGVQNDLLMDSTPDNQDMAGGNKGSAGVKCMSGKKRSFTDSTLTAQSVDLVESYGGTQSKRTVEFIPDDDDLLSSILVGRRSSALKMKPTPTAPEVASIKRHRSAPRTSASKRKVLMDDTMVLHGDTIRHQLTNTEDIRRIRKKAPCTRCEILMIQRQFLEDEIFHKPIFTGVSADLIFLQNETFDLTGIKICDYDTDTCFIEAKNDRESYAQINVTEFHGLERNIEPLALQGDGEVQHVEIPDTHGHTDVISHVKELDGSQIAEMKNGGGNIEVSDAENGSIAHGLESTYLTESVFENNTCLPDDSTASVALMDKSNDVEGSMQTDILSMPTAQSLNTLPVLENKLVEDGSDRSGVGAKETAEHSVVIRTQVHTDGSEATYNLYASFNTDSKQMGEHINNQASFNGVLPTEENGNSKLEGLNVDQIPAFGLGCDDKISRSCCMYSENTRVDCLHAKETSLNDEQNSTCQEAGILSTMHPEVSAVDNPVVDHNEENATVADDTGFLNVGDDEIVEDDDNYIPCAEGTHLENSGWSSRTRAVAKYLQALFDKEELHGRKNLPLDNILASKTRKEASRMFFETLVLKTRDYVHVEQMKPYANINVKSRVKLMQSDF